MVPLSLVHLAVAIRHLTATAVRLTATVRLTIAGLTLTRASLTATVRLAIAGLTLERAPNSGINSAMTQQLMRSPQSACCRRRIRARALLGLPPRSACCRPRLTSRRRRKPSLWLCCRVQATPCGVQRGCDSFVSSPPGHPLRREPVSVAGAQVCSRLEQRLHAFGCRRRFRRGRDVQCSRTELCGRVDLMQRRLAREQEPQAVEVSTRGRTVQRGHTVLVCHAQ